MLRFKIFGIPVEIHPLFWLIAAVIGHALATGGPGLIGPKFVVAVAAVIVSIIGHELGHALAYRHFGGYPSIALVGLGGLTSSSGHYDRGKTIAITAAGPAVSVLLAGVALAAWFAMGMPRPTNLGVFGLRVIYFINFYWAVLNLLPVYPLDGGIILGAILGPRRQRATWMTGLIVGGLVTLYAIVRIQPWLALIFGMLTYANWRRLQGKPSPMF